MSKPSYHVFITQESQPDAQCEKNTYWTKVGVAFAHHGKAGLNIVLTPGIAVSGKLVLLEPREENSPPKNTDPVETAQ
ncbi:TPA: hypothetical protein ACNRRR_004790 [Citrobacter freundii]|uniref:hypothetical protein n=1 Tax=Klebsiella oxytoca TaxID=571 RepID=UPI00115955D2|nr:hypothetical protein [Klebsiella oxytoca]EKU2182072.1 hypothetical protein [Citrobacter freundii]EKV4364373.1 hypothetical protein [Citrobacter freundii]MBZ7657392.1 hypothetical protein [Klebsiella oxytoca]HDT6516668.1 hypothetical protein [Citrobacter freundii]